MSNGRASAAKGARAERWVAEWFSVRLRVPARRMLGAGRKDDVGDIAGLVGFTVQVADRGALGAVLRHKPLDCEKQQAHGRTAYGATVMKLPTVAGGKPAEFRVVLTLEQFASIYEALREHHGWPSLDSTG